MEGRGFKLSAVVVGLALTLGGSLLVGFCIGIVLGAAVFGAGTPPDQIEAAVVELANSTPILAVFLVVGSGFTALGGYVAARMAPSAPFTHAVVLALASIGLGLLFAETGTQPLWFVVSNYVLAVPAALAGAGPVARRSRTLLPEPQPALPASG